MHVECRLALNQLWDHGGQHGQESEEGKEEDSQEEKEVTVRRKPHGIRITSEVRNAFATRTGGSFRLQNIRATVGPDHYADGCCITVRLFILGKVCFGQCLCIFRLRERCCCLRIAELWGLQRWVGFP